MANNIELENYIWLWAAWEIGFAEKKHGWPKESPLYKYLIEGFVGNNNLARSSSIPWHYPEAEKINVFFNLLKKEKRELSEALYAYYVLGFHGARAKAFAKTHNIAPRTFYKRVDSAKKWIGEKLMLDGGFSE